MKNISVPVLLFLCLACLCTAQTAITTTTTTGDVGLNDKRIPLTSNASINAGDVCLYDRELFEVVSFEPPGTTGARNAISKRGVAGMQSAHLSGAGVHCGSRAWLHSSDAAGYCTYEVAWINTVSGRVWLCKANQWVEALAEATCNAAQRGKIIVVPAAAGSADTVRVCVKAADNSYAWTALF